MTLISRHGWHQLTPCQITCCTKRQLQPYPTFLPKCRPDNPSGHNCTTGMRTTRLATTWAARSATGYRGATWSEKAPTALEPRSQQLTISSSLEARSTARIADHRGTSTRRLDFLHFLPGLLSWEQAIEATLAIHELPSLSL